MISKEKAEDSEDHGTEIKLREKNGPSRYQAILNLSEQLKIDFAKGWIVDLILGFLDCPAAEAG